MSEDQSQTADPVEPPDPDDIPQDNPEGGAPSSGKPPEHDLGILLVHGIGRQQAGETLIRFGEPIVKWIQGWFEGIGHVKASTAAGSSESTSTAATVAPPPTVIRKGELNVERSRITGAGGSPAHAALTLRVHTLGHEPQRSRWLMAESFWGATFQPPTFFELAFWGFVVFPWTNAVHFGAVIRRRWDKAVRAPFPRRWALLVWLPVVSLLLLAGSVASSVIALLALGLLLILALPPIPSVRSALLKVQRALTRSLGDSFILIDSPLQAAAIVTQVRRDLRWLTARCRRVVVIAHSQGAVASFEALKGNAAKVSTFVTLGSGISKLELIRRSVRSESWWQGFLALAAPFAAIYIIDMVGWVDLVPWQDPDPEMSAWSLVWVGAFWAIAAGKSFEASRFVPSDFDPQICLGSPVHWRDYYASEDPIPNGPLMDADPPYMVSREVFNRHAIWNDHTTYWSNREEFLPLVVADLARAAELPLMDLARGDQARLDEAGRERRRRVLLFARCRLLAWVLAAMLVVIVAVEGDRLNELGKSVLQRMAFADSVLSWIGLESASPGKLALSPRSCDVCGVLTIAATVAAAYAVLFLAWLWWGRATTRALFRRTALDQTSRWMFGWTAIVLAQLLALGWSGRFDWNFDAGDAAGWLVGGVVAAIIGAWLLRSAFVRRWASAEGFAMESCTGIVLTWPLAIWAGRALLDGSYPATVTISAAGLAGALLTWPVKWIVGEPAAEPAP